MIQITPEMEGLSATKIAQMLNCSRTAVLFAKRRAAGLCERCGGAKEGEGRFCADHARSERGRMRDYQRATRKYEPWKPGSPGRPPIDRMEPCQS